MNYSASFEFIPPVLSLVRSFARDTFYEKGVS